MDELDRSEIIILFNEAWKSGEIWVSEELRELSGVLRAYSKWEYEG